MLPEMVRLWHQTQLRPIRLLNAYGPTETTITATAFEVEPRVAEDVSLHRVPIGRPLANRATYILDRYCDPVPIGIAGELHIGGVSLARGYLNQPNLTAEKFIPDPFSNRAGSRLYKTGGTSRTLSARRQHRVHWPNRSSGEDSRFPNRTRGSRGGTRATSLGAPNDRFNPSRWRRRRAPGGLCGR